MVGRETGWAWFQVCLDTKEGTIRATVAGETGRVAHTFTDENCSYLWLENEKEFRTRKAIDHSTTRTEREMASGGPHQHNRGNLG